MGLKLLQIVGHREALAVECDDPAHGDEIRTAWFDCGSHSDNLTLAIAAGWGERRNNRTSIWLCPYAFAGTQTAHTWRARTFHANSIPGIGPLAPPNYSCQAQRACEVRSV
jgi:hypothetical protein